MNNDNNEPARYDPLRQCFSFHLVALQIVERCHHSDLALAVLAPTEHKPS